MMHGREQSYPAVGARKPANNAGQPAAERVERRAGTEGNAGQQSTRRAQYRESVSRTDPDERVSRIRLLPRMFDGKAWRLAVRAPALWPTAYRTASAPGISTFSRLNGWP